MTKAEMVEEISIQTGVEKVVVFTVVESCLKVLKNTLINGKNIYIRGFGTFHLKKRALKMARNISKNTTVFIPAHQIPRFKPSKDFVKKVREKNPILG